MPTVHKFELAITGKEQKVMLCGPYSINHFGEQDGRLFMWAEHYPGYSENPIYLTIYGTGHPIKADIATHRGTVQMSNGLVWHIYETYAKGDKDAKY